MDGWNAILGGILLNKPEKLWKDMTWFCKDDGIELRRYEFYKEIMK